MAETFGIAAGALGLLGVIDASMSIGGKVLEYTKDFRDEKDEHRRLVCELGIIQSTLPLLRNKLEDARSSDNPALERAAKGLEVKDGPLDQYRSCIERIETELEKARSGSTNIHPAPATTSLSGQSPNRPWWKKVTSGKSKVQTSDSSIPSHTSPTLRQRLAWPSTLDDIKTDLERIGRFQSSVILVFTAGAPAANEIAKKLQDVIRQNVGNQVSGVSQDVNGVLKVLESMGDNLEALVLEQSRQRRREIAEWLTDIQSTTPLFKATSGTGKWFTESEYFTKWVNGDFRVLYCPGDPGTGKTILMKLALEHLDIKCRGDPQRMAIRYYFNSQASASITISDLVAYILKTLIQHRALSTTTSKLAPIMAKPDARPSNEEVLSLVCEEIKSYDRLYLVLDALDESPSDMSTRLRRFVVDNLPPNVSLLCTSRRIQNIMDAATTAEQVIALSSHLGDMETYIASFFLDSSSEFCQLVARTQDVDQSTLTSRVLERARGMFLLVRLIMVRLKGQRAPSKLKDALDSLPSDLYEMYEQTIRRSPDPESTLKLLFWVYLARRWLSPLELVHAVAWTLEMTAPLTNQDLEDEGRLLSACGGMVEVRTRERELGYRKVLVSEVVFTHYSTEEYIAKLFRKRESIDSTADAFVVNQPTHAHMALLSLHYIQHHIKPIPLVPTPPLLRYCLQNWMWHATQYADDEKLLTEALKLLVDDEKIELINQFEEKESRTSLHIVAWGGLHQLVPEVSRHNLEALNAMWGDGTPLHVACGHGHIKVIEALLLYQRDSTQVQLEGSQAAVQETKCLDRQARNAEGRTPLHLAAYYNQPAVVKLLASTAGGININAGDNDGRTALHLAADKDRAEAAEALALVDGVDPNARDNDGRTPLHLAARSSGPRLVSFLATVAGIDLNARDNKSQTPVHLTTVLDRWKVVEALLAVEGFDVNAQTDDGRTPLHCAVTCYSRKSIEILSFSKAVNNNARDHEGCTPLHFAARYGYLKIVNSLISAPGVDINAKDNKGRTFLHAAAACAEMFASAIQKVFPALYKIPGIDRDAKDHDGKTALDLAAERGWVLERDDAQTSTEKG